MLSIYENWIIEFKRLKNKPYWGNKFWARGYCVDTVGLDSEMIRKYVKYHSINQFLKIDIELQCQLLSPC